MAGKHAGAGILGQGQEDFGLRIADLRLMEIVTAFGLAMTGPGAKR